MEALPDESHWKQGKFLLFYEDYNYFSTFRGMIVGILCNRFACESCHGQIAVAPEC
jgi:hypothetical protein